MPRQYVDVVQGEEQILARQYDLRPLAFAGFVCGTCDFAGRESNQFAGLLKLHPPLHVLCRHVPNPMNVSKSAQRVIVAWMRFIVDWLFG